MSAQTIRNNKPTQGLQTTAASKTKFTSTGRGKNQLKEKAKANSTVRRQAATVKKQAKGVSTTSVEQLKAKPKKIGLGSFRLIPHRGTGGVFIYDGKKWRKLCSPAQPLGYVINADGSEPELMLQIRNRLEDPIKIKLGQEEFESPKSTVRALSNKGLDIAFTPEDDRAKLLHHYLRIKVPPKVFIRTKTDGWLRFKDSLAYVSGAKVYGDKVDFSVENVAAASTRHSKGDINDWLDVTTLIGNDELPVVMIGAALASVMLYPLNCDPSIIVLVGKSSTGKSTILKLISALFGSPSDVATWETTANGFEAALAMHRDQPFVIDEIGQGGAKLFFSIAYRATNGASKMRANQSGQLSVGGRNRSMILSAGEVSPFDVMTAAGVSSTGGQHARILCVPAAMTDGVWSSTEGFDSGADKSQKIAKMLAESHGVAATSYCQFVGPRINAIVAEYAEYADKIRTKVSGGIDTSDSIVGRVLESFLLFTYANKIARDAKCVNWSIAQITDAARKGFLSWYSEYEKTRPVTNDSILNQVKLFFQSNRNNSFKKLTDSSQEHQGQLAGYEHTFKNGECVFLVFPAFFEKVICKGLVLKMVLGILIDRELLIQGNRKTPTKQVHVPGRGNRNQSFYAISQNVLFD